MARPTKEEIDAWNARMAEPEEEEDDFEIVLFDDDGNPVTSMPYKRAKAHLKRRGIDLDDVIDTNANAANNAPTEPPTDPAQQRGYFKGSRRPAVNPASPANTGNPIGV